MKKNINKTIDDMTLWDLRGLIEFCETRIALLAQKGLSTEVYENTQALAWNKIQEKEIQQVIDQYYNIYKGEINL